MVKGYFSMLNSKNSFEINSYIKRVFHQFLYFEKPTNSFVGIEIIINVCQKMYLQKFIFLPIFSHQFINHKYRIPCWLDCFCSVFYKFIQSLKFCVIKITYIEKVCVVKKIAFVLKHLTLPPNLHNINLINKSYMSHQHSRK